jgi:hypothetical protein
VAACSSSRWIGAATSTTLAPLFAAGASLPPSSPWRWPGSVPGSLARGLTWTTLVPFSSPSPWTVPPPGSRGPRLSSWKASGGRPSGAGNFVGPSCAY